MKQVALVLCQKVDDPEAASLAAALCAPPNLPNSTRARDHRSLLRPQQKCDLQGAVRVVVETLADEFGEDMRLDEAHDRLYAIGVLTTSQIGRAPRGCATPVSLRFSHARKVFAKP